MTVSSSFDCLPGLMPSSRFSFAGLARTLFGLLLAVTLAASLAACSSSGSNDEDDSTFPEPPGRPSAEQVDADTTIGSTDVSTTATDPAPVRP